MKIAIAAAGRFWLLDTAREFDKLGVDTKLYSYIPRFHAHKYGLPVHCFVHLLPLVAPSVAWARLASGFLPALREKVLTKQLNFWVSRKLEPCDIFICLSGVYLEAAKFAKQKYGAAIWLERASRHILSQAEICTGFGEKGPSQFAIDRELEGYEIADRIVVPSSHVQESFQERAPHLCTKIFRNPFGTDLSMFPMVKGNETARNNGSFTLVTAGGWSLRKGSDLLAEAVHRCPGVKLIHVGGLGAMPFPEGDQFEHIEPVPQFQLSEIYKRADAYIQPSREEGLALVQPQAMSSGLPLITTERSGGRDLGHNAVLCDRIIEAPCEDVDSLVDAINTMRNKIKVMKPLDATTRSLLGWEAYGARYLNELQTS